MKWNNKFLSITAIISPLCLDTSSCCVYYTFKLSFTTCSLHKKSLSLRRAANCTCAPFSCTQSLLYIPKVNCCSLGDHTFAHVMELYSPQMIPNHKWSRDRKWSPKWTANDPRPQVIPKVDRKWSRENLRNGMDFMGLITKKDWL